MCPGGVKAGLSLMSLEVLSIMRVNIIDVTWSTNSAAIALHVFLWIILNFPAIEGAIFTTTARNLCVYDVIIKMVY